MIQNEDKNETYKVLLADDEQIERMALAKRLHKHLETAMSSGRQQTEMRRSACVLKNGARS